MSEETKNSGEKLGNNMPSANQLTDAELGEVVGGVKAAPPAPDKPVEYLKVTMTDVLVSGS